MKLQLKKINLFDVPIYGAGTKDIESLPSYLIRLAAAHTISVKQLSEFFAANDPLADQETSFRRPRFTSNKDLVSFVRPNPSTESFIRYLHHFTHVPNPECMTFIPLTEPFQSSRHSFSYDIRWCKLCVRKAIARDEFGYLKLAWHFRDVSYCDVHMLRLSNTCPSCYAKQLCRDHRTSLTRCRSCDASLDKKILKSDYVDPVDQIAGDLYKLVGNMAANPALNFPRHAAKKFILQTIGHSSTKSIDCYQPDPDLKKLIFKRTAEPKIALTHIRGFAASFGVDLCDILSGNTEGLNGEVNPNWGKDFTDRIKNRRSLADDWDTLLERIQHARFSLYEQNPSLRLISKVVETTVGCIRYRYPELAVQITEEYQRRFKVTLEMKRIRVRAAVVKYFFNENIPEQGKTHRVALQALRIKTGLPRQMLRKEIAVVFGNYMYCRQGKPNKFAA